MTIGAPEPASMRLSAARLLPREELRRRAGSVPMEGRNLIGGSFRDAEEGRTFDSIDPATGRRLCAVARSGEADVALAVEVARRQFKGGAWSRLAPRDRMDVLFRLADLIEENALAFALLDVLDVGKPIADMFETDIPQAILAFRFFAEAIDKTSGLATNTALTDLNIILREPLGVIGAITPWNYPLLNAAWKVAPALACGNSVVLKPSEYSPLSAGLLAALFLRAGGPEGVLNVVHGFGGEAGRALALSMGVEKIAFTGSVETGKQILISAGQSNMKQVSTECGGKTPQIIMADCADLDRAVRACVGGLYANQGEVCSAGSRILVARGLHDDFVDRFVRIARDAYVPGDPLDPATRMGPLVSRAQKQRVLGYINSGLRDGARPVLGGPADPSDPDSCYVAPTLFTDVTPSMRIAQEEIFGPVGVVIPFDGYDEAIAIANGTIFGLAASIWTRDLNTALRAARDIEAGVVWVNCFDRGDMTQTWGGCKQSGNGREKCMETLEQYSQTKSVWFQIGT